MRRQAIGSLILLSLCGAAVFGRFASRLHAADVNELMDQLDKQLAPRPLRAEVSFTIEQVENGQSRWSRGISDLRADGRRIEIISEMSDSVATPDRLDTANFTRATHLLVDAESSTLYNRPIEPGALGNAAVSNDRQRMRKQVSAHPAAVLLGHFARDLEPIIAIMKTGAITVTDETSRDGTPCYLLQSKTLAEGLYKVRIDSKAPYSIQRVEIGKASGEQFMGQPLASSPTTAVADSAEPDNRPFAKDRWWPASVTYEYEVKEFQQVQGTRLPEKSDYTLTMTFADGTTHVSKVHCDWRHIDLGPDFAKLGAFEVAIPDGAVAFPAENPERKNHVWKDGKIVPVEK